MKKFEIVAIGQSRVIMVFVGLFLLLFLLIIVLIKTGHMSVFSLLGALILVVLLFLYFKKYFTYSLVLELLQNGFKISKGNIEQEVLFNDIDNYKVEALDGVRLEIRLKNEKKITMVTSNNFGSNPEALEDFCNRFEEQVKIYQIQTPTAIKKRRSFLETQFGFYFVIGLSVIGFGGILIVLFTGKGLSVTMLVIVVPLLILISALIKARNKKDI